MLCSFACSLQSFKSLEFVIPDLIRDPWIVAGIVSSAAWIAGQPRNDKDAFFTSSSPRSG
jgi:hypothetical protein